MVFEVESLNNFTLKHKMIMRINEIMAPLEPFLSECPFLENYRSEFDNITTDRLNSLRISLLDRLNQEDKQELTAVGNVIFQALIQLAVLSPLNDVDYITHEPIKENDDRVFTSSGHQFDIRQLLAFRTQRTAFINPATNLSFSVRDQQHIQQVAQEKKIQFTIVPQNPPPSLRTHFAHVLMRVGWIRHDPQTFQDGIVQLRESHASGAGFGL